MMFYLKSTKDGVTFWAMVNGPMLHMQPDPIHAEAFGEHEAETLRLVIEKFYNCKCVAVPCDELHIPAKIKDLLRLGEREGEA